MNKELILKIKKYLELGVIVEDKSKRKLAENYFKKARHNLLIAKFLKEGTNSSKVLALIGFQEDFYAYDWIVNASYYAMYMAAQSVLAAIDIKCENHTATPYALEYYFAEKGKLEQEYVRLLKDQQGLIAEKDIEILQEGKEARLEAQYDVTKSMEKRTALKIIGDADRFLERLDILLEVISK